MSGIRRQAKTSLSNSGLYMTNPMARTAYIGAKSVVAPMDVTFQPMTKRRRDIFQGRENISKKMILEKIEEGSVKGIELIRRVAESPTEYSSLLHEAYNELEAMQELREEAIKRDLDNLLEKEGDVLKEISEYEALKEELLEERRKTEVQIKAGEYQLKSLNEEATRLCNLIESDKRKNRLTSNKEIDDIRFNDNKNESLEFRIEMYQRERSKLESLCESKEMKLNELNKEIQVLCHTKTRYNPQ